MGSEPLEEYCATLVYSRHWQWNENLKLKPFPDGAAANLHLYMGKKRQNQWSSTHRLAMEHKYS